ncbi:MAG: hypothetical protein WCG25_08765 [bacterium]
MIVCFAGIINHLFFWITYCQKSCVFHSHLQALFLKLSFVIVQSGNQTFIGISLFVLLVNCVQISFSFAEFVEKFKPDVIFQLLQKLAVMSVMLCQRTKGESSR